MRQAGELRAVVEDEMPGSVPFERLDRDNVEPGHFEASLLFQDSLSRVLWVFQVVKVVIGKEPSLLTVVARDILISNQQYLPIGHEAYVCDQLVDLTSSGFHGDLPPKSELRHREVCDVISTGGWPASQRTARTKPMKETSCRSVATFFQAVGGLPNGGVDRPQRKARNAQ
jgi:hypothetical protein